MKFRMRAIRSDLKKSVHNKFAGPGANITAN